MRVIHVIPFVACCGLLVGCAGGGVTNTDLLSALLSQPPTLLAALPVVPADAAYVEAHPDSFRTHIDQSLVYAQPGQVVDDLLSHLQGCWGAFADTTASQSQLPPGFGFDEATESRSIRFDLENGRLTQQIINRNGPLLGDESSENVAAFHVSGADRITVDRLVSGYRYSTLVSAFGADLSGDNGPLSASEIAANANPYELLITIDGDSMVMFYGPDVDAGTVQPGPDSPNTVLSRFECPP